MEENKEIFENENSMTDTDTFTEENTAETAEDTSEATEPVNDEFTAEEVEAFAEEMAEQPAPKKKQRLLQTSIIISIIIVAVVALGFLVYACFFNTSIVGTWSMQMEDTATSDEASQNDEAATYYIFEDNGVVSVAFGTVKHVGTYSLSTSTDGTPMVSFEVQSINLSVSFEYEVTGNIFTGRTLTFKDSMYDYDYTFNSTNRVIPELKVADDFKADDAVVGEWNYFDGYYNFTYSINKNGTISINQNDMIYIDGVYTVADGVITVTYYTDQELTTEMAYTVDEDQLVLNGLPYYRVGSASADEARANLSAQDSLNLY